MPGYGIAGHFGIAKETTWGTPVVATHYAPIMTENFSPQLDRFDLANVVGRFSEPDDMAGLFRLQGSISMAAEPTMIGHLLRAALGVASMATTSSPTMIHTFTLGNSDFSTTAPYPPYTIELYRDVGSSQRMEGCELTNLEMSAAPNEAVMFNSEWLAETYLNIARTTPTFPSSPAQPFAFDTASLSIGGALTAEWERFSVQIQNPMEAIGTLANTTAISKIRRTNAQLVRFSGQLGFENITEMLNFQNQTEQRVFINFTRAGSFALLLDMPRVVYTTYPLGMNGRGRQIVGVEGMARYHAGSANAIKVTLTNIQSVYS
jgi:hypothetical protein